MCKLFCDIRIFKLFSATLLLSVLLFACDSQNRSAEYRNENSPRIEENFGSNWQFQRIEDSLSKDWDTINIPHTVKIEPLVVNDQWQGKSLYRKNFAVESIEDQKWFFHFEGVMQEARVSVNDSLITTHKGGYLPFTVDATNYLQENAENKIKVEVINVDDSTIPPGKPLEDLDFNLYGGIYRNVHLIKTGPVYITDAVHADEVNGGGILVHFDSINDQKASGFVKTHLKNESQEDKEISLKIIFSSENGENHEFETSREIVFANSDISITENISVDNPKLWSTSDPNLYVVQVEVISKGEVLDSKNIRTGIRNIKLTGEAFYLNGEEMLINGTNRHQEYPYIGYALSDEAQYRDAYKIKEAGFDFVRLSHYPQATAFIEACDELGLLVMDAIPGWQYYEESEFVENAIQDIKDMARRDRNYPSVVFWENSLNESGMTDEFMIRANEVLKAELPYDDIYTAGWIDHPSYDLFIPARQHAKPPKYWNHYNNPGRPIFIAEYGDWEYYAQNAGFNQKAFSDLKEEERSSRQLRSAGEAGLLQQALNYQEAFNSNLKGAQTIGHANWLMFDYNRGYSDDLEASGISDIFRIPKFAFYFYKSQKAPDVDEFVEPMVFIANFWTPESTKNIRIFSNTEEVTLYLNGEQVEKKKPERNEISEELPFPPFTFGLKKFEPGELKAVGFIDGEEVAEHIVRTPQEATKIEIAVDRSGKDLATKTPDVVFIYAKILDENGTVLPDATNPVQFSMEGNPENVEIIGGELIEAEAGIATILLRTEYFSEPLVIKATSEGLDGDEITITK